MKQYRFSDPEDEKFERKCNYERYRTLVQIDATGGTKKQGQNQSPYFLPSVFF